jgi:hypothetical protein
VAYNRTHDEYLVVWEADPGALGLADNEFEIYGQRMRAQDGALVGPNDFRISALGTDGNAATDARLPRVAYATFEVQYLVVFWEQAPDAWGIRGQRLAPDGQQVGTDDFIIRRANEMLPDLAYNQFDGEYLVVWQSLSPPDSEIGVRRVDAGTGALLSPFKLISSTGGEGDAFAADDPTVEYDPSRQRYLVVWKADDPATGAGDEEFEIFGQYLDREANEVGPDDFRLSDMGGTGDDAFGARDHPAIAYGAGPGRFLVTWWGDDDVGGLVDDEWEIFGQQLTGSESDLLRDGFEGGGTWVWDDTVPP